MRKTGKKRKGTIIFGPTASGKSSLALELADEKGGIIVNSDSLQVYRDLRILTACPDDRDLARAPHHLYRIMAGSDNCTVGRYIALLKGLLDEETGYPIIVGGTGLYVKALLEGFSPMPEIPEEVRKIAREKDIGEIRDFVKINDPDYLFRDAQRLRRAYEIIKASGKPYTYWQELPTKRPIDMDFELIILNPPREELYRRCNIRFEHMLEQGAIEEVEALLSKGYPQEATVMKAIGVQEIAKYKAGQLNREEMIRISQQHTRNYAKRQITWIRTQFQVKN